MKRNLFVLFLALVMVTALLVSCGDKCDHTFSENWESNATHHWHPATCEHGEVKDNLAEHVDANEDGICDVCAYAGVGHEHTYAEEWVSDEYYHWHESTCSHDDKGGYELHSDNNLDCICDYCEGHVHAMNIIGYCADRACGKQLKAPEDIENFDFAYIVYATGVSGYDKINGGTIDYDFTGRSNTGPEYEANIIQKVEYMLGEGFTYSKRYTDSTNAGVNLTDTLECWFEVDGDGAFGVTSSDGGESFDIVAASTDHLYGYYYALSTFADAHGAENILYKLFELSQDPNARDFEYTLDEDAGSASFNYGYLVVNVTSAGTNVNYYEAAVSFTYGEQYALTGFEVTLDCYTGDPGVADGVGFLYEDVDLEYNETTGVFNLLPNALADTYTVKVTQTVGERNAVNDHPKASFIPDSFEIFTDIEFTKPIGDRVSINVDEFLYIYLGNFSPVNAQHVQNAVKFEVYDESGSLLITNVGTNYAPLLFFNCDRATGYFTCTDGADGKALVFRPLDEGNFTYKIYLEGELVYEFIIHANKVTAPNVQVGENQLAVQVVAPYANGVSKATFVAETAGIYTFTFEDNLTFVNADEYDAAFDEEGNIVGEYTVYYDFQNPFTEKTFSFIVELDANETIRFYVTSDKSGTYVVDYSVN